MEEKNLSGEESLQLIAKMINQAKNYYYESGLGALLWGFSNVICFTLAYLDAKKWFHLPFNPFLLMGITILLQIYFDKREKKFKTATTYMDDVHSYTWLAFGVGVLIVSVAGGLAGLNYWTLPVLLVLFGIPTFTSGCIMKFRPFIFGGVACWLISIAAFFVKNHESYLLVAVGAAFAWIIPGFILRLRFYKNKITPAHGF